MKNLTVASPNLFFSVVFLEAVRQYILWAVVLVVLLLSGCGSPPPSTLHIGTNVWQGYGPLYLADEKGYYGKSSIRMVEYASATQVLQAFRNGAIEGAALTLDEALQLAQDVPDIAIVLVMDFSDGADALLARPGIDSLAALRGKRVGIESTALGAYMATRALQQAGLTQEDIIPVPVWVDAHERAYLEGRVDALITFEPVRSRLRAKGAKELFNSSQIPNEIMDVLVLRRSVIKGNDKQVRALLQGWFRALDFIRQDTPAAARLLAPRLGITPAEVITTFKELRLAEHGDNYAMLEGQPPQLLGIATKLQEILLKNNLLREPLDIARLIEPGSHKDLNQ